MLPRRSSGSLYSLLGISEDATARDVRKAYYRLALQLHPDRNQGQSAEQFKKVHEAYSILSDPQQRRTYDTFGMKGVETFNRMGDLNIPVSPASVLVATFVIALALLLLLVQLELIIARIDYNKTWPWPSLLTPMWIALLPFLPTGLAFTFRGLIECDFSALGVGVECLLLIGALGTFVAGLAGAVNPLVALVPATVLYVLDSIRVLCRAGLSHFEHSQDENQGASYSTKTYLMFLLTMIFERFCFGVFFAFSLLRAADSVSQIPDNFPTYWLIFSPLIVYFGLLTIADFVSALLREPPEQNESSYVARLFSALFSCLFHGSFLYMTCLTAAKCSVELDEIPSSLHPSASLILLPLRIVLVTSFFFLCCVSCLANRLFNSKMDVEGSEDGEDTMLMRGENQEGRHTERCIV
uniref:Putative heat shock protein n=1 Tax=Trypanosoma vivax (strain Y486) TaxID=1055687 RepID=G0U2J9_TRYVY|nr:putative heat shock protein [Trypanosoma vivax Y486]